MEPTPFNEGDVVLEQCVTDVHSERGCFKIKDRDIPIVHRISKYTGRSD
jgi:hypothetical protein